MPWLGAPPPGIPRAGSCKAVAHVASWESYRIRAECGIDGAGGSPCEERTLTIIDTFAAVHPHDKAQGASSDRLDLTSHILSSLDDAKAEDVLPIDLKGKTSLADTMVIATGRSTTHVSAIADRVAKACKEVGIVAKVEGLPHCDWVLVDASDVIVHIFRPEVRQFYNLEKLWGTDRPAEERRAG